MTEQEEISQFVTAVFQAWQAASVDWLVLRNYENLPNSTTNDIDVLVDRRHLHQAEEILLSTAGNSGFRLHNRVEFATLAFYFSSTRAGSLAHFDLFTALKWRSLEYLYCDRFLEQKVNQGLFAIPHPAHEAATNLLATMIYTGAIKDKYKPSILHGFQVAPPEALQILSRTYGQRLAQTIVSAISAEKWDQVQNLTGDLRKTLVLRQAAGQPIKALGPLFSDTRRLVNRYLHPPGLSLVLCGADGSGKSTVARGIIEGLAGTFSPLKGRHYHWKPPVFSGARQAARGPADDPHGKPPRNGFLSLLYFALHWLEFLSGSHLRIRPVTFRGGLVLIDRYYYDFFVDQRRYRLRVPRWLIRLGFAFLKKPDLVILLDAPADVLQGRKQEVPAGETRRQRDAYLELIGNLSNGQVINAAQPIEAVINDAKKLVLDFMTRRTVVRWPHTAAPSAESSPPISK